MVLCDALNAFAKLVIGDEPACNRFALCVQWTLFIYLTNKLFFIVFLRLHNVLSQNF